MNRQKTREFLKIRDVLTNRHTSIATDIYPVLKMEVNKNVK